jgi:V/A-type H+/Na+-transporting ATPase subunit D
MSVAVAAVSPTRTELLERRRRTDLAVQGRDLLSDKRAALVRAFSARSARLLERLAEAEHSAATARRRLDEAHAAIGTKALQSAGLAAQRRLGVEASASVVDDVAAAYEAGLDDLLELAALELTVRRLAAEIARTTRQVNALEHVLIPRLRQEARQIAAALEEREREEVARLRRARARSAAGRTR